MYFLIPVQLEKVLYSLNAEQHSSYIVVFDVENYYMYVNIYLI